MLSPRGSNNVCVGFDSGTAITAGTGIITIGPVTGVHSVFGQVDDRTYIANIRNAAVDEGTAQVVYVDADGRLGTLPKLLDPNAAYLNLLLPKASGPKPCPTTPNKPC